MQKLLEKAKTITEIAGEGGFNQPEVSTVRWVRLEDAEQALAELKQKLRCWYKQEAWFHLPLEVREHFLELLKEEKEAKPT